MKPLALMLMLLTGLAFARNHSDAAYSITIMPWNDGSSPITSLRIDGPANGPEFIWVRLQYDCGGHNACEATGEAFQVTPGAWLAAFHGIENPIGAYVVAAPEK